MDLRGCHVTYNQLHGRSQHCVRRHIVPYRTGVVQLVPQGLNYGLDFTGGTLIELTYERPADVTKVREQLASSGYSDAIVQSFGATTDLLVRMPGADPQLGHQVAEALQKAGGDNPAQVKRVEFVGPQVGEELRDQAASAC